MSEKNMPNREEILEKLATGAAIQATSAAVSSASKKEEGKEVLINTVFGAIGGAVGSATRLALETFTNQKPSVVMAASTMSSIVSRYGLSRLRKKGDVEEEEE